MNYVNRVIFIIGAIFYQGKGIEMKKKDTQYFEELLKNQLEELLSQADNTVSGMTTPKENFPDPTDRATLESDRNFMLRIRDREHKLIKKIKKALERIENGTFGICEKCGEDISIERLKARPVTTYCIDCKTKEEAFEKSLGL
jgi:DnaK suppressor protein